MVGAARRRRRASGRARWSGSSSSRAGSPRAGTGRRARGRARSTSRASCAGTRRRTEVPEAALAARATRSTCRRSSRASSATRSSHVARRLIDQGGVKLNGEPVGGLDVPRGGARRRARSRSGSAGSSGSTRLTGPERCYYAPAARKGGVGKSLQLDTTERSQAPTRIRYEFDASEASGASRRPFLRRRTSGTGL